MYTKDRFIEEYIECETQKVLDAYLSVGIESRSGKEKVSQKLLDCLQGTTQYLGLKDFFTENTDSEVRIGTDIISLENSYDAWTVLNAIIDKDVIVYITADENNVDGIAKYFGQAVNEHINSGQLFINWIHSDDGYLLQLRKRTDCDYILRIYPNGKGVIAAQAKRTDIYKTFYFQLTDDVLKNIRDIIEEKSDYIISHTECVHEDDREYGFAVSLKYGLLWKYLDANQRLEYGMVYEDKEYENDEFQIRTAKQILSIPIIKDKWLKL